MIDRRWAVKIELVVFVLFVFLHVGYAWIFLPVDVGLKVTVYAALTSVGAAFSLLCVKDLLRSQTFFMVCIMIATQLIGAEIGSLAMGICIYMIAGALISIIGSSKLNKRYFVIVNLALAIGYIMEEDAISKFLPLRYYGMLVIFCEAFLITENLMVLLYQTKVEEVETQNDLLNLVQKEKNQFFANMSHEIRTPMNAIIGMSELIMREVDTTDKIREYCYNIRLSGENLLNIINDILDFSKLESGKMDVVYNPYSFASLIQDVINTTMFRKGYKDIDIIIDCSPDMPKTMIGDELRLRQILANIVNNAIKFTEQGYVFIELTCHEIEGENYLKLKVEDTGIGIKKEDQVHLFDAFNRTDYLQNRYVEGTGLGLAICRELVGLMHGTIKLYSEYEKGTTVIVDIPQKIADATHFLQIKKQENMYVGIYVDKEHYLKPGDFHYNEATAHFWDGLGIPFKVITEFTDLMNCVENKKITHLFVGEGEYMDQKSYFDKIAGQLQVYVTHGVQTDVSLPGNVKEVMLPFCSVNIVTAMNGEPLYHQFIEEKAVKILFSAPSVKVLVVDDNDINLRVADGMLKLYDMDVNIVHSGKEAVKRLEKQDIDLVFMDHMMPEMDGVETTRLIRDTYHEYGQSLPIVAMTANAVNDAKNMFLENGFQDFLAKPIILKELNIILEKWLPESKRILKNDNDQKLVTVMNQETKTSDVMNALKKEETAGSEEAFIPMEVNEAYALENMGGMRDLYKELLEYSLEMQQERMKEIQDCFEKKDYAEYQIRVHALKGAMRSLGVEEMAQKAQEQEFACKEGRFQDVENGYENFVAECDRAHKSIKKHLETME